MKMSIRTMVMAVAVAITASTSVAVAKEDGSGKTSTAQIPAGPQVPVAEVISRNIIPSAEFTGSLAAIKTVELRPRVGGTIESVSVPEGSLVHKGQLLFQIDPRPFQVALDSAKAQLRQAEAQAFQANRNFERVSRLVNNGAVSRKDYDDAASDKNARIAQVNVAQAAVEAAKLDLSYTRVTAPIDGRVDRILITEGNLISNSEGGAATLLTTIVSSNPLYAYFDIDEATFLNTVSKARPDAMEGSKEKLPVHVGLATEKGYPHSGTLDFVGNQIDRNTGTVRVRAIIPNTDGLLTPGAFARVQLGTGKAQQVILINDQAVGTNQGNKYVLVIGDDSKAQYRPIELGPVVDGLRIVAKGLQAGEKIIIKGLVRPGMAVTPSMVSMQSLESSLDAKPATQGKASDSNNKGGN
ncbi:efflux RND transporter periplasmic adaptor subunit [Enterobacter cloacae complex sp. IR53043]|nr:MULTISPECIES: efflux RND transporter periplasmic adaptor subunit [Enterobacteriaceae]ARZ78570.1 MexE family multidrug efflux RND transporter periplasmic adaptor subunit [Enterobacter cloacae complex sp.]KMK20543.1 transporter [Pluralibacter gergoviae]MDP8648041.1 efflux RND transporter periplasmic adaptor subunit [Serratia marcescens]RFP41308.1 efflux RND transporter periplasmic adaptor subunit [Klebsiella oxytoca]ROD45464.1 efflux RND transporter periplasmic adaptor subunit [Klebsiella pne